MKIGAAAIAAVFYFVFLGGMFLAFTGHISRVTLGRDLTPGTGSLDTLIFRVTRERELQARLDKASPALLEAQAKLAELNLQTSKYNQLYYQQLQRLHETFLPIIADVTSHRDIIGLDYVDKVRFAYVTPNDDDEQKASDLAALLAVPEFLVTAPPNDVLAFAKNIAAMHADLNERRAYLGQANSDWQRTLQEETLQKSDVLERVAQRDAMQAELAVLSQGLSDTNRAVLASYGSLGGLPYYVLKIPTIILTLLVTIAAGGLGSTISFTRKFFGDDVTKASVSRLLINAAEGVAAAVAIFFLAGSGMLMLTQGVEGTNQGVELSPYLIACIAFISGFMAEDAFSRIQLAGKNLFRAPGATPP